MLAPWVMEEMKDVDLQDKRLNERFGAVLDMLGRHPSASIPAACGGYAEMVAAYRFFDNEKVTFESVLEPHIEATMRRMADHPVVIVAQDTTEIDVTRPTQQMAGVGPMDSGSRRGAFLHPLMGFTPDGTPLGTLYAEAWTRDSNTDAQPRSEQERINTPIEEKESLRWLESLQQADQASAELTDTQLVCVADSESDIYEVLDEAQRPDAKADWIVRACQDRALQSDCSGSNASRRLRERVLAEDVLFTRKINVRGREPRLNCEERGRRQPREPRIAKVEVRAVRVTLRAPWRPDRQLTDRSVNVVMVTEVSPPAGERPVEWILLTSLPIDKREQVKTVIEYYSVRWMIEIFFRTLKSGCRVEGRRFEHVSRFLPCLAIYMIVTWRTLFVCRVGRELPDVSCETVFEPAEWKSVYHVVKNETPPVTPPTLKQMVRLVAQLGGYVNRPRDDDPGPQTVWLGLQRTHDIAKCWNTFGPGAKKQRQLV